MVGRFREKECFLLRVSFVLGLKTKVTTVSEDPAPRGWFVSEFDSPLAVSAFWSGKLVS